MIKKHLDKDNPHHAYLLEGSKEELLPEIIEFIESLGMKTAGNPDFYNISTDSFKIEDARNLKSITTEKGFSSKSNSKKVFLISANTFLLEAQNTMLKMFEEPIENTHFFIIVPDANALIKTFISRFYLISSKQDLGSEIKEAEKFIAMPLAKRIDYIKELLTEGEEEEEILPTDFAKPKAIRFLNAVEVSLHKKEKSYNLTAFKQIFKVREYLRLPGSSTKSLMESVALVIPVLQ